MTIPVFTRIFVTFRVAGFHRWQNAPLGFDYLGRLHRHVFHVRVDMYVDHAQRDVEFIRFKSEAEVLFRALGSPHSVDGVNFGDRSCEQLAKDFLSALSGYRIKTIEVSEDGENGGVVEAVESRGEITPVTA